MTHAASIPITVAYGDGIGPEIMEAALYVLQEAGAQLSVESITIGERIYKQGAKDGMLPGAWPLLARTGLLLAAPVVMPKSKHIEPVALAISRQMALKHCMLDALAAAPDVRAIISQGDDFAMFEPHHDAQPALTGKDKADPRPMIWAAQALLRHIGQGQVASQIEQALQRIAAEGIAPKLAKDSQTRHALGMQDYCKELVARLG